MYADRERKLRERMARAQREKDALRAAFREQVGTEPPDETREADREALRILSNAMTTHSRAIQKAMAEGQSWTALAQTALTDFPPAATTATRVHVSGAGDSYHRFRDCPALSAGKEMARDEGKSIHGVKGMKLAEAEERVGFRGRPLRACNTCFPWPRV